MIPTRYLVPLLCGLTWLAAPEAFGRPFRQYFCIDELVIPELPPIVPGCEVIDCCPGCPGPGWIDWRIRVVGDPIGRFVLDFEGLAPELAARLELKGGRNGSLQRDQLVLGPGEFVLRGLTADHKGRPPVVLPRIEWDEAALKQRMETADVNDPKPGADAGGLELHVTQFLGDFPIRESTYLIRLRWCWPKLPLPCDEVVLTNNTSNDSAIVLLDGKRASCIDDEIARAVSRTCVPNLRRPGACNVEAAVFSDDNAMEFISPVTIWTDPIGDTLSAALDPLPTIPVTVWIMRGPLANTQTRVNNDMARANQLYNTMNCGIGFGPVTIQDATADPDTAGLLNAACGQAANLRNRIGFTANQLNVYYLNDPGARGWHCGNNTLIVGAGADNESLAHEFGHALSLGHTNSISCMSGTNLMVTGGTGRDNITEGQCFRCNLNPSSDLNELGVRTGTTRTCADATTSNQCPDLCLDANPN